VDRTIANDALCEHIVPDRSRVRLGPGRGAADWSWLCTQVRVL